jgi:hypothetical protein
LSAPSAAAASGPAGLAEARALHWRQPVTDATLRRGERRWTIWTGAVVAQGVGLGSLLLWLEPLLFPMAAMCFAWAWLIPRLQASRGTGSLVPVGSPRSASRRSDTDRGAERAALGLLGDLVGHDARKLLGETGVALERGRLGVWLIGERGAILVRPGGRRVDCWCVRVAEADGLPAGDRVAHLLLALREDEAGFATVANHQFSGAAWRVRRLLPRETRPALDRARLVSRQRARAPALGPGCVGGRAD